MTGMFGKCIWVIITLFDRKTVAFKKSFAMVVGRGQTPDYWNNDYFDDTYLRNGNAEKQRGYCTDLWFQGAMEFMEEQSKGDAPFFCYLVTNAPHGPFHVAQEYIDIYRDNPNVPNPTLWNDFQYRR